MSSPTHLTNSRAEGAHPPPVSIELLAIRKLIDSRELISGEGFWAVYKKLRRAFYQSDAWRKLSRRIRAKRKHCIMCERKFDLDVHHVDYLFNCPERGLDPANLVVLCRKHHNEVHEGKLIIKVAA